MDGEEQGESEKEEEGEGRVTACTPSAACNINASSRPYFKRDARPRQLHGREQCRRTSLQEAPTRFRKGGKKHQSTNTSGPRGPWFSGLRLKVATPTSLKCPSGSSTACARAGCQCPRPRH